MTDKPMTDPTRLEEIRPGELTVREWAQERYDNTVRILCKKTGADRAGWLEDSEYWLAILTQLDAQAQTIQTLTDANARLVSQAVSISLLLGDAGVGSCTILEGVVDLRETIQTQAATIEKLEKWISRRPLEPIQSEQAATMADNDVRLMTTRRLLEILAAREAVEGK